ncbi:hypothetical protein TNCV_2518161 [Trichonephila clavipes]|nr:hypothetical protein TNCV_2518161 [Trichonephila clavipes]
MDLQNFMYKLGRVVVIGYSSKHLDSPRISWAFVIRNRGQMTRTIPELASYSAMVKLSLHQKKMPNSKGTFTTRRTNVERLANQRLHFAQLKSDWLDADSLGVNSA